MRTFDIVRKVLDISLLDILRIINRRFPIRVSHSMPSIEYCLSDYQIQLLEEMRRDVEHAGPPFKPSLRWRQELTGLFEKLFRIEGIQNPEDQEYNLRFSGFAPSDIRLHRYICWMYRSLLAKRDSLGLLSRLQATCKEGRGYGYRMENNFLSLDLLFSIDDFYGLYELNPAVATDPLIIADLGAGWGRLGYVLNHVNPQCTYIVFDLPEILLISQTYLPTLFPNIVIQNYEQSRLLDRFKKQSLKSAHMWFLGPQDILKFDTASIDMIVNIGSFQEMPVDYISQYFRHFSRVAAGGCCFLRQLRDGKSQGQCLDDFYQFPNYWKRRFLRSSTLSDEFFEAGFEIPPI